MVVEQDIATDLPKKLTFKDRLIRASFGMREAFNDTPVGRRINELVDVIEHHTSPNREIINTDPNKLYFLVLGGINGSGKGSLTEKFISDYSVEVKDRESGNFKKEPLFGIIRTGDFARDISDHGLNGHYGHKYGYLFNSVDGVADLSNGGGLISDDVINAFVRAEVNEFLKQGKHTILFDGFPRTQPQIEFLQQLLKDFATERGLQTRYRILISDISINTVVNRTISRLVHQRRKDDNAESITKRVNTFTLKTAPTYAQEYYNNQPIVMLDADRSDIVDEEESKQAVYDNAVRLLRRERRPVVQLAREMAYWVHRFPVRRVVRKPNPERKIFTMEEIQAKFDEARSVQLNNLNN